VTDERRHLLVIANETVCGKRLLEAIQARAADGGVRVTILAPVTQPRQGYVVYDNTRRASARRRLDQALERLRAAGIPADGITVEADPVDVVRDGVNRIEPDEVIVSTHPRQKSGWLRRDQVEQMRRVAGDRRFEHVVVDLQAEDSGEANVLVLANQTVLGSPLLDKIRERASHGPASFLIVSPQGDGDASYEEAERRLRRALTLLRGEGIDAHGEIAHPDPYQAAKIAIDEQRVDELIVSTFPNTKSGWLRRDLVERLRRDFDVPVDHVVFDPAAAEVPA
jgi:predicted deacetylase